MSLAEAIEDAYEARAVAVIGNALGVLAQELAARVAADPALAITAAGGDPLVITSADWARVLGTDAVDLVGDVVVDSTSRAALVIGTNVTDRAVADVVDAHVGNLRAWGAKLSDEVAEALREGVAAGRTLDEVVGDLTAGSGPLSLGQARRIARTELPAAANGGMFAGWVAGGVSAKRWLSRDDARVRAAHRRADGQVVPVHLPFQIAGRSAMYPGDPSLPVDLRANCLPGWQPVEASGVERAYRRWFVGELVEIETASGHRASVTPNHPVMTTEGPVAAGRVHEGTRVLCRPSAGGLGRAHPDVEHGPVPIRELFESLADPVHAQRMPVRPVDFHGDGSDGEVDVVPGDALLGDRPEADAGQQASQLRLASTDAGARSLVGAGSTPQGGGPVSGATPSGVGRLGQRPPATGVEPGHTERLLRAAVPEGHPLAAKPPGDRGPGDTQLVREELRSFAGQVAPDEVVAVRRREWSGHVYNLQTRTSFYLADGITVGNCRCSMDRVDVDGAGRPADLTSATAAQLADVARARGLPTTGLGKAGLVDAIEADRAGTGHRLEALTRVQMLLRAKAAGIRGRWAMTRGRLMTALRGRNPDRPGTGRLATPPVRTPMTQADADRFRVDAGYVTRGDLLNARARASRRAARTATGIQSTTDPVAVRARVFDDYGGRRVGYVPCVGCGLKLHWTRAADANPAGLQVMVRVPIEPDTGLAATNVMPGCPACADTVARTGPGRILRRR